MPNILKLAGIALLLITLSGCDNKKSPEEASQHSQVVKLVDGKLSFTLPAGMMDKSNSEQLKNNMHIFANTTAQKTVIAIESNALSDPLDVLSKRLEDQQRSRDPQMVLHANKAIAINGLKAQQLDTELSVAGQSAWSSIVLVNVGDKLMTLQISLPRGNPQQSQAEADAIINTLAVK
ncbi:MAG: hypothetical protein XXXJIFNMEKO3_03056 [Candidatus Erwinia impunctatus]|nr:hypothetical protein XXXJIFNMEKO_03056 [Culicoides impunctatus]